MDIPRTLEWCGDAHQGFLRLLDQTKLPRQEAYLDCTTCEQVWGAIKRLSVRGAPAIGVTAAYGIVIGLQPFVELPHEEFRQKVDDVCEYLASSRPTAVNLFWAINRLQQLADSLPHQPNDDLVSLLHQEACEVEREDREMCEAIGRHGAELIDNGMGVLTHCNAGGLATAGDGTALSVFFAATRSGKQIHVYADETRPLLQGARLTSWECQKRGVPVTVICDSMAGWLMKEGRVQAVVTGADRIAANGDAANKIGTYSVARLAAAHGIPFYVAAPSSTFDLLLEHGGLIPIEQRDSQEITHGFGPQTVPDGVDVYNPAFDVTPAELIAALITEQGVISPVNENSIRKTLTTVNT